MTGIEKLVSLRNWAEKASNDPIYVSSVIEDLLTGTHLMADQIIELQTRIADMEERYCHYCD